MKSAYSQIELDKSSAHKSYLNKAKDHHSGVDNSKNLFIYLFASNAVQFLDKKRAVILKLLLKRLIARQIYSTRALRLGLRFLVLTSICFPLSLYYPAILLVCGPIAFGYAHLISSYRFSGLRENQMIKKLQTNMLFTTFAITTVLSISLRLLLEKTSLLDDLPFGLWELGVATGLFIIVSRYEKKLNLWRTTTTIAVFGIMALAANLDPLIFVGGVLILHNWISLIYWIAASQNKEDRTVALTAILIFTALHYLTISGYFDNLIGFRNDTGFFASEIEVTGWVLAPWSRDPVVWSRWIVVYTYGLSIHYFAWLNAIPENLSPHQFPNSFRLTIKNLKENLGKRALGIAMGLAVLGTAIWIISYPFGKVLYFSLATLHGWIEILFLIQVLL